jgi:hypothetical protein
MSYGIEAICDLVSRSPKLSQFASFVYSTRTRAGEEGVLQSVLLQELRSCPRDADKLPHWSFAAETGRGNQASPLGKLKDALLPS